MDCQARHKRQLDFAFNTSFASLNAAKVFMKDNSMAKVKSLMFNANYTKLIFYMFRYRPDRTLISKIGYCNDNIFQSQFILQKPSHCPLTCTSSSTDTNKFTFDDFCHGVQLPHTTPSCATTGKKMPLLVWA